MRDQNQIGIRQLAVVGHVAVRIDMNDLFAIAHHDRGVAHAGYLQRLVPCQILVRHSRFDSYCRLRSVNLRIVCNFGAPKLFLRTMKPYLTIGLLVISNIFMTFAWYGQLRLKGHKWFDNLPFLLVVVFMLGYCSSWNTCFRYREPDRFSRERGTFHAVPAQGDPRSRFADGFHRFRPADVQNGDVPLESCRGIRLPRSGGLLRVQEIICRIAHFHHSCEEYRADFFAKK